MLNFKMPNDKEEQGVKIRFKSSINNNNNYTNQNGNGMQKSSNNGFNYHESLLNKKRKLENDLKNGNINNFNKVLNNAVLNSNRNNNNELIPNKIEFKLSHILKGEKKITYNTTLNLTDFNINNTMLDFDKNNIIKKNSDKLSISDNLNNNAYTVGNFENKKSKIDFIENNKYNSSLNIQKNSDSDNTSDLTKTSSIEDRNKRISNFNRENIILSNIEISMEKKDTNYNSLDFLKSTSIRSQEDLNTFNDIKKELNEARSVIRKDSYLSNSSDKAKKLQKNQFFHDVFIDSLLEWKKPTHVGSGLNNMGNTCFLNSVLQSLLYTPGLINYFLVSEHKKKCNPRGICLMCEFHCLIETSKGIKAASLTPKNVLNNLKLISKNIKIGRQEDAHEFLLYLLDGLEKACKHFVTASKNNFIVPSNLNDDNLIQKLFGANLASCVICLRCKNVSKKIDRYLDISIDILNCDSIHRSFKNYCKSESLSGSNKFYCENCKMKNDSLKKFSFENFPRVLIIHLKRFDNFQRKIKKFIEYPADLDLTSFSENKTQKYKYRLYAVLVHEGSTISWGHYYCYIKNSNDLWYCMNDSHVSQTSLKNVLSQTPYLLFYERVLEKKIESNGAIVRKNSVDNLQRKMSNEISNNTNVKIIRSVSNGSIENSVQTNINQNKNIDNKSENSHKQITISNSIEKPKDNKNDKENKDTYNKFDKLQNLNNKIHSNNTKSELEGTEDKNQNNDKNINLAKKRSEEIKDKNMIDETIKIIKSEEEISKKIEDVIYKEKINEDNNKKGLKSNLNILNIPQKNSLDNINDNNKINYKKSILELKYNENNKDEDSKNITTNKEENSYCMGINEIKKAFLGNTEKLIGESNIKTNIKKNEEENYNLLKSKTSFEIKFDICEKIDQKETSEIKNELAPLIISEVNTRSRNITLMSRKFKRLMSIYSKLSAINKNSNLNFFSKNSKENVQTDFESSINAKKITDLDLCEEQNLNLEGNLNLNKNVEKQPNINKIIITHSENEYKKENDLNNTESQETEAPAKKRIFNTKLNEMYNGRFIERWEDDEDDENELNKLRSQAEFVRKSDAFKKQKILKKSKYDMDYDAGKQKKVRIYEENDSKGKNVFQQMHTTIIKKVKKGIDPNKLITNSKYSRDAKRKDKKFKKPNRKENFKYSKGKFDFKKRNNKFNDRIKNKNFNGWNKK